jgi:diguanylate cyclase (GGDEF)-like protein
MSGADFILGINLSVAGLLAVAFLALAAYEARRVTALRLAAAYGIGMGYYAIELSIPAFRDADAAVSAAFAVFLLATMVFNAALAGKYHVRLPLLPLLAFLAGTTALVWLSQSMERHSLLRMAAYQLPYAVMQAVGLAIVWRARQKRDRLDYLLMAVLCASALHFLAKPFIAHALGGWGANPQSYLTSPYAMVSQSLGTVFALALALLTLVILVRDILAEASSRSETDSLSGLLNRGGFHRRAGLALREAAHKHLPVALAVADLDHFKAINDGFGHACGDRVIETFAALLRDTAGEGAIAGRIGGEEFAVLLPGSNLAGARLFAEGTRSTFGALTVKGLPPDHRCSASFGVTELLPQDEIDDLRPRAARALSAANKRGRDRVRVATEAAAAGAVSGRG